MQPRSERGARREKGMAVIVTAITLLMLIPMMGLAVDGGMAFIVKARLGTALDAAALASGRGLLTGTSQSDAAANATTAAQEFYSGNFPSGYMNTSYVTQTACGGTSQSTCVGQPTGGYESCTTNVCATFAPNSSGLLVITVTATVSNPTYFMRWIGVNSLNITGVGQATRPNLAIVLVLDKSSSMGSRDSAVGTMPTSINYSTAHSCEAMVYNAYQFSQSFSPFDSVAMISFGGTVTLDYAPSNNFKATGSTGIKNSIANINCGSNTNTTGALAMAGSVINYINQPQALNHIVLFTDGVANGVNSSAFPLRTTTTVPNGTHDYRMSPGPANASLTGSAKTANNTACSDSSGTSLCDMGTCVTSGTSITGVITQVSGFATNGGVMNLLKAFGTNYPYTGTLGSGDSSSPSLPSGCGSTYSDYTSAGAVQGTIAYIPSTDRFGNSTSGLWDGVIEQVNSHTAPSGTPITPGNSSSKNLTGLWSSYTTTGTNTAYSGHNPGNTFPSGSFNNYFRPDLPNTIGVVSLNTAYNMVKTMQANALAGSNPANWSNPTNKYKLTLDAIYLQGNGGDPIEPYFLQYLSNQTSLQSPSCIYVASSYPYTVSYVTNPNYVSSAPQGSFVAASSTTQLSVAFAQVAGSLLRVTQ